MTCCWETVISILGAILKDVKHHGGIIAPLRSLLSGQSVKDKSKKTQDILAMCLKSLQSAARLADQLGNLYIFYFS